MRMKFKDSPSYKLIATLWHTPVALVLTLSCTFLITLFDAAIPLLTGSAIDQAIASDRSGISAIIITLVVVSLGRYLFQFGRRFFAGYISNHLQHRLRVGILENLLHLDGPAHDRLRTGQVVSRTISDLNTVQIMIAMLPLMIGQAFKVILFTGILMWISPVLSVLALITIPILVWLGQKSRKTLFAATWAAQQKIADMSTHIEETIQGVRIVKAFHQENREIDTLQQQATEVYGHKLRVARLSARFKPLLQNIPTVTLVLSIGIGGLLSLNGAITIGEFLAASVYLSALSSVISMLAAMSVQVHMGLSSADRIFEVLELRPEYTEPEKPQELNPHAQALGLRISNLHYSDVLNGLDLDLAPRSYTSLVGPAGSGKSMLIQLLAGFYQPDSGKISLIEEGPNPATRNYTDLSLSSIRSSIACVFDEPFLSHATIRENIDAGRHLSDEEILCACRMACIDDFIERAPNGLDSLIGERGLTLSGGQRQRVALARALVAHPKVLLLDDTTSAIDSATEARIYANLREHFPHTTVLAITHRHSTLAHSDYVGLIHKGHMVAIDSPERIADNPQFSELMDVELDTNDLDLSATPQLTAPPEGLIAEAIRSPQLSETEETTGLDSLSDTELEELLWSSRSYDEKESSNRTTTSGALKAAASLAGAKGMSHGAAFAAMAGATPATKNLLARVDRLPSIKDLPPRGGADSFRQKMRVVNARTLFFSVRYYLMVLIALYILGVIASLAIPTLIGRAIDEGIKQNNVSTLLTLTGIGLLAVVMSWLATIASEFLSARTGESLLYELRIRSYSHLQRLSLGFYEKVMSGAIITRMTTDIDALNGFLQNGFTVFVVSLSTIAGIVILLVATSVKLSLIAAIGIPLIAVATVVFRSISSKLYTQAREEVSTVNAHFHESMSGLRTAQLFNQEAEVLKDFERQAAHYRRTRIKAQTAVAVYFPGINATTEILSASVLGVGALMVADQTLSAGVLVAFLLYLERLFGPVQHLSQVFDAYQQAAVGFRRISDLLSTENSDAAEQQEETTDAHRTLQVQRSYSSTDIRRLAREAIDFEQVNFHYRDVDEAALSDINLHIEPGTTVAIVGPTGSGKSTLIKLLLRFYDPISGRIKAGAQPLSDLPVGLWRETIGFVPQETYLFHGTIASNIAYGKPQASRADITQAVKNVGALKIFAALPDGLATPVREHGQGLSSGQRQLVALARAELVQPSILVLDEATATLDPATEKVIVEASHHVAHTRTAFVVAHRLATAENADRILVVDKGRIVEDGSHNELRSSGGTYATLWKVARSQSEPPLTPKVKPRTL
ncbi:ABC transporter ATP-binding protein [Corynebacterium sp. ES2715-CONJ3]|uniref:ABC transporter ATP-binding protein n=1 Tax=Corynebacterium sp. ES2715-CONJ3 TaxID=2974028 RepID=UPI00216A9FC1|nr:ABC transporter ATP-binding protein [Corynebacterium sp. ES2715-CONJ3]MCS4491773.1 ABC transporter ATP-binding protein/permease [Corynebacterium sp. ES2715-CONJ3]